MKWHGQHCLDMCKTYSLLNQLIWLRLKIIDPLKIDGWNILESYINMVPTPFKKKCISTCCAISKSKLHASRPPSLTSTFLRHFWRQKPNVPSPLHAPFATFRPAGKPQRRKKNMVGFLGGKTLGRHALSTPEFSFRKGPKKKLDSPNKMNPRKNDGLRLRNYFSSWGCLCFSMYVDFREGISPYRKLHPKFETLIFLFHVKASGVDIFIEVPHWDA